MRALILVAVVLAVAFGPADVWAAQRALTEEAEAKVLREMAAAIPLGARVKAHTREGVRVDGTLLGVTDDAVIIKARTRLPEPAVAIAFADLARLDLHTGGGMSPGKVAGLGLAVGAGAILTLVAFFAALAD